MTCVSPVSVELAAPESVGIDPRRLWLFLDRVQLEVDEGPLPSAQVAIARDGRLVAFETYGGAAPDKRYILQSVGRTVVAAAVWKLISDGLLEVGEHVADIIPEFGTNGKDVVTVGQVLTHRGFPVRPARLSQDAGQAKAPGGLRQVASGLGARVSPAVPPDRGGMADRGDDRAQDGHNVPQLPAHRHRGAARFRVPAARPRRLLRVRSGCAGSHRPDRGGSDTRPVGPVVPGERRGARCG